MLTKTHKKLRKYLKKISRNPHFRKVLILSLAIIFLYFIFAIFSINKVLFNSYIGNENIGGLDATKAREVINRKITDFEESKATFVLDDKIVEVKVRDLGIKIDSDATFNKFYLMGKRGNLVYDLSLNLVSVFGNNQITPVYRVNVVSLNNFVDTNFADFEQNAQDAKVILENGLPKIVESEDGHVIDRTKLLSDLLQTVDKLSEKPVELTVVDDYAKIKSEQLSSGFEKYKKIANKKIILAFGFDNWLLQEDDLLSMLKVSRKDLSDGYIIKINTGDFSAFVSDLEFDGYDKKTVDLSIDEEKIDSFLGKISKTIDRPTINATATFDGEKITQFKPAIDGQRLDLVKTKKLILDSISVDYDETSKIVSINLPVVVTSAKVDNDRINSLGIRELIGKGVSYFAGSIANRVFNIELGANRVNGTLVAPGEVFSFNNSVGEVSAKTGYKQAYVISSGRTVLDDGGGICQVSTTVFRAALNSGLPIVSRTAHAYRVGYYEQKGFGPGLDATVFAPSVDFKFKNDTDNYILVQSVFDRTNSKLEIDIYGTRDGRTVDIGKPVVSNRVAAPADKYQDDQTLPKGVIKQVDFAAEGADAYFTRKVYKNGGLIYDDIFKSRFRPWQAIFLVGTGG